MKRVIVFVAVTLLIVGGSYLAIYGFAGKSKPQYEFAPVTRADVENTVTASGTLSPTTTVEVGTQVSGTIDRVLVDFNDQVAEGQVLVVLDTSLLKAAVIDAEANLERVQAQLELTRNDWTRNKQLFDRNLISESEFLSFDVSLRVQQATVKSAQTALDRARRNLEYAVIRSPISGIVIGKSVEAGQTVAASLSTPTLFIIAQDLDRMEILVDVDESDIGQIKVGQQVRFEVTAYASKVFTGEVTQIRLQPKTVSNVVTYTVVANASNEEGLLLPGMTATVDFVTAERRDVLVVPTRALRFQPSEEQVAQALERFRAEREAQAPDSLAAGGEGSRRGTPGRGRGAATERVWTLNASGEIVMMPVRTGLADGTNTEIVFSRMLSEGDTLIVGSSESGTPARATRMSNRPPGFGPGRF